MTGYFLNIQFSISKKSLVFNLCNTNVYLNVIMIIPYKIGIDLCVLFYFNSLRKEEIAALSGPNEFAEFYTRLKSLKDFHKKHPNEVICGFIRIMPFIRQKLSLLCQHWQLFEDILIYISHCLFIFQISVPMAVEFEELDKLRENPDESAGWLQSLDVSYSCPNCFIIRNILQHTCTLQNVKTGFGRNTLSFITFVLFLAMVDFTDEEGYGRYLDMHECYIRFINLKGIEVCFCSCNIISE